MKRWLPRVIGGLRALVRPATAARELDSELREFFDAAVERGLRAGMSRDAAIARARREIGNVDLIKDEMRDAGWESIVESSYRDVRYGARMLRKAPGFAGVAIAALALGIGANTAIFSILNSLLFKPLPVSEPHQLVVVGSDDDEAVPVSYPVWNAMRDSRLLPQPVAWAMDRLAVTDSVELKHIDVMWATGDVFGVLGVPAVIGRTFDARDDRRGGGRDGPVAVISHAYWQRQFGGAPGVVGRRLSIERVPFTIVGVTPRTFFGVNVGAAVDVMLPLETEPLLGRPQKRLGGGNFPWLQVMCRLGDGQTVRSVGSGLAAAQPAIREATMPPYEHAEDRARYLSDPWIVKAAPGGVSRLRAQYNVALLTLLGVVGLVLLVACTSISTLMLARSSARQREFTVRRALGAGRGRLLRQLLVETLWLSVIGATIGVLLAQWGSRVLVAQLATWFSTAFLDLSVDWRVLSVTVAMTVVTALLCGIVPAYRSSRVPPSDALKHQSATLAGDGGRGVGVLLVVQIALSLVLICGAGIFLRSFAALTYRDLGFDRSRLLVAVVDARRTNVPALERGELYERVRAAIATVPGVDGAAISLATPLGSAGIRLTPDVTMPADAAFAGQTHRILMAPVSPGWFHTYGTRLLAGRDFDVNDRSGAADVVIVNDAFARRYFDGRSPLGHTLIETVGSNERRSLQIVGLVQDAAFTNIRTAIDPTVYRPLAQRLDERVLKAIPAMSVSVRAVDGVSPGSLGDAVARAVSTVDPNLTVFNQTVTLQLRHLYMRERLLASVSAVFGLLGLVLAATGLAGVTAYAVRVRRREIAIRMALGADRSSVVRSVMRPLVWYACMGIVLGTIASVWGARFTQTLLFGIDARDPLTFAIAAIVLGAVVMIAAGVPARRASAVEPTVALRES